MSLKEASVTNENTPSRGAGGQGMASVLWSSVDVVTKKGSLATSVEITGTVQWGGSAISYACTGDDSPVLTTGYGEVDSTSGPEFGEVAWTSFHSKLDGHAAASQKVTKFAIVIPSGLDHDSGFTSDHSQQQAENSATADIDIVREESGLFKASNTASSGVVTCIGVSVTSTDETKEVSCENAKLEHPDTNSKVPEHKAHQTRPYRYEYRK